MRFELPLIDPFIAMNSREIPKTAEMKYVCNQSQGALMTPERNLIKIIDFCLLIGFAAVI